MASDNDLIQVDDGTGGSTSQKSLRRRTDEEIPSSSKDNVHSPAKQLRTNQEDEQSSALNIHQPPDLKEYASLNSSSLTGVIEKCEQIKSEKAIQLNKRREVGRIPSNDELIDFFQIDKKVVKPLSKDGQKEEITSQRRSEMCKKVSELKHFVDPMPNNRIMACMGFNKQNTLLATVGPSKEIKIYGFVFLSKPNKKGDFPIQILADPETATSSYISSLAWSRDTNQTMVTSDYRGHVLLWNVNEETPIYRWREHTTRVWSVDFNHFDQDLFASGSDDFTVKLYDTKQAGSTDEISLSKNVCSVEFSPFEKNQLLIGSSNKTAVIYDIRNLSKPLKVFEGHDRTVSYAQFLSRNEIVTASIDSTARVWDVNDGTCKRVLSEHYNKKYFTGLANKNGYILCGSEDNTVYLYHKDHPSSKHSYKITEEYDDNFISSICWKKDSNYALVANNHGRLHVLQINTEL